MTDFSTFGLAPKLTATLAESGFTDPTPIQTQAIPLAMQGADILGLAQTGTGKTLAFALPLIHQLLTNPEKAVPKSARALVLAPTRELVNQIAETFKLLASASGVRIATIVGGQSINRQITALARGHHVIIATPGRLIDLMERGSVDLGSVKYLVLDEADQMLDIGFIHALRQIAPRLGTPRQTMLFSATMPKQIEELSRTYLSDPKRVQVSPPGKAADKVRQSVQFMQQGDKPARLREVLRRDPDALTLVFSRTKHGAEKLMKNLVADGFNAASIHGNKSQGQRDRAIKAFRDGEVTTLVATDVAARGIDIPGVAYVVNYDLPEVPDNYVHRIGRTARAGRDGEAIAFCSPDEFDRLRQIQKLMKIEIPVVGGGRLPETGGGGEPSGRPQQRRRGPKPGGSGMKAAGPKPANAGANPKRRRPRRARAA